MHWQSVLSIVTQISSFVFTLNFAPFRDQNIGSSVPRTLKQLTGRRKDQLTKAEFTSCSQLFKIGTLNLHMLVDKSGQIVEYTSVIHFLSLFQPHSLCKLYVRR